jgi:F0F1-type ATP synthase delta subunit
MDTYSSEQLAAALAPVIRAHKVDFSLLANDISAEVMRKKGVVIGTLSVAHQPDDQQIARIEQQLAKALSAKAISLDVLVDSELIGGFVAQTPAGTVDASVITMLDKLEVA